MYFMSAQGVDEHTINVHYYYCYCQVSMAPNQSPLMMLLLMFLLVMPSRYDTKSVSTDDVSVDVLVGNAKSV